MSTTRAVLRGILVTGLTLGIIATLACGNNRGNWKGITCQGGAELIASDCYCARGMVYNGQTCQGTPVAGTCQGNSFPFGPPSADGTENCHCLAGFALNNGVCEQLQCTGGAVAGYSQCECGAGTTWDGTQCVAPQPTCSGGAVVGADNQCACPDGTAWDGNQCAAAQPSGVTCPGGAVATADNQCACPDGTAWDGTQCTGQQPTAGATCGGGSMPDPNGRCVCPANTAWNGAQCAAVAARGCQRTMIAMHYSPGDMDNCRGVDDRCAVAMLKHRYSPGDVRNCVGVDGACAEQLLNHGGSPGDVQHCQR